MSFRRFAEDWDHEGAKVTAQEVAHAQVRLQSALRDAVKGMGRPSGSPYHNYKDHPISLGSVSDFFPRAADVHPRLARVSVVFDPTLGDAASTNGAFINIGKFGFKHRGTSMSLGDTFFHEVEHCLDAMRGHYLGGKGFETEVGERAVSEFTPRLRQLLRQLKDEPDFRIWNYLHSKHGYDHARNYADRYLHTAKRFVPTPEEEDFAARMVVKRAKEIFDKMVADDPEGWH